MKNFGRFKDTRFLELKEAEQVALIKDNKLGQNGESSGTDYQIPKKKKKNILSRFFTSKKQNKHELVYKPLTIATRWELTQTPNDLRLNHDLKNEIYRYLISIHKKQIDFRYQIVAAEVKKNTLGANQIKKRELALKYLENEIFSTGVDPNSTLIYTQSNENFDAMPDYFSEVYKKRQSLVDKLDDHEDLYMHYLVGDESFFKDQSDYNSIYIDELIDLESSINIIIKLNNVFSFVDDHILVRPKELYQLFEENDDLFMDFKGLKFLDHYLNNEKDLSKTVINSLFAAMLLKRLVYNKRKEFKDFINLNFELPFEIKEIKTLNSRYRPKIELIRRDEIIKQIDIFFNVLEDKIDNKS